MRQSKKVIQAVSQESAETAFAEYNQATAQLQILEGKMNEEITKVKSKYEAKVNQLQEEKQYAFETLQAFAAGNEQLFTTKKSVEWIHGVFGFRTGTPKLATRKGFKWPAVLELVKEKMSQFIRVKEDVDKEGLIANRDSLDLKSVGVEVVQDETFYVQPALDKVAI